MQRIKKKEWGLDWIKKMRTRLDKKNLISLHDEGWN